MKKKKQEISQKDILKYEIAEELGLLEKIEKEGWKALSARENGKIGGIMNKRQKKK